MKKINKKQTLHASKMMMDSKSCETELKYKKTLQKPLVRFLKFETKLKLTLTEISKTKSHTEVASIKRSKLYTIISHHANI